MNKRMERREPVKVTIDIDCTPQEARSFFGLPDFEPMQKVMMKELEGRMIEHMNTLQDPEALFKSWAALGGQGLEQFQKFMTVAMSGGDGSAGRKK